MKVKLIEFFQSYQGEAVDSGRRMLILRFKRCSRTVPCYFCDTQVKMRITEEAEYSLNQIQTSINEKKCGLMITGGECSYDINLPQTVEMLNKLQYPIANVETNGYNLEKLLVEVKPRKPVKFIWSPKIFTEEELTECIKMSDKFVNDKRVYVKAVVDPKEFSYRGNNIESFMLVTFFDHLCKIGFDERTYLMPEGKTKDELINNSPLVMDLCEKFMFNFSSRNHIIFGFI